MKKLAAILFIFIPLACSAAGPWYAAPGGGAAASCVDATTNVCTVDRARVVASDGETIILAPGTYSASELGASGYLLISSENLTLQCSGERFSCIFQPSAAGAISGIRLNSPTTTAFTWDGIKIDTSEAVGGVDQCFYLSDGAATYSYTIKNTYCTDTKFYDIRQEANEANGTITDNEYYTTTEIAPYSFYNMVATATTGTISILRNIVNMSKVNVGGKAIVNISPTAGGPTVDIENNVFNSFVDPEATGSGNHNGIYIQNISNAVIKNNSVLVRGNYGARASIGISCGSTAAVSSDNCLIQENTVYNGTTSGQALQIGSDLTSSGNGFATNGKIIKNKVFCETDNTDTHGSLYGWSPGGEIRGNYFKNCGYGAISKEQTTGAIISSNIVDGCWLIGLYSKGSASAKMVGNGINVTNSNCSPIYLGVNSASGTNSTNAYIYNNNIDANGASPTNLLFSAASQTIAEASNNNWTGFSSIQFTYLGVAYTSLTTWNAVGVVGTDMSTPPLYSERSAQTLWDRFKIQPTSSLYHAGIANSYQKVDFNGRPFYMWGPTIGPYEFTSGFKAKERTPR